MLVLPKDPIKDKLREARNNLVHHYNGEMEKILNANSKVEKYWILGKVRFPENMKGQVAHSFLQACMEKPPLVKESFLYEVDNTRGVKTLLWVMNPDGSLRLPTLGKTIQASPAKKGVK